MKTFSITGELQNFIKTFLSEQSCGRGFLTMTLHPERAELHEDTLLNIVILEEELQ